MRTDVAVDAEFETAPAPLARLRGTPLVLMLDVDGTLAPIAPRPEDAFVPPETRALIAAFAARADTHVALVSGRAAADALRLVAVPGLWAAGNHGFELARPGLAPRAHPDVAPFRDAVAAAALDLRSALADLAGVIVEDKGLTLSVHYRLASIDAVPAVLAAAERVALTRNLRASTGKMIVELRPPMPIDKGTAVLALAAELGGQVPGASLLFAGDDVTDEDAFVRLRAEHPHAVTVHVGDRATTAAEFRLRDTAAFQALLAALLADRR